MERVCVSYFKKYRSTVCYLEKTGPVLLQTIRSVHVGPAQSNRSFYMQTGQICHMSPQHSCKSQRVLLVRERYVTPCKKVHSLTAGKFGTVWGRVTLWALVSKVLTVESYHDGFPYVCRRLGWRLQLARWAALLSLGRTFWSAHCAYIDIMCHGPPQSARI